MNASFGSISSGTMRAEDLIPCFYDMLKWLDTDKVHAKLLEEADNVEDYDSEEASEVLSDLFDALDGFAPAYGYFGAHPGDGSDYGFWLGECFEDDFDGLKVNDTSDVPEDYVGEVLHVNDHGNCTLYAADKGKLREVWAVV